MSVTVTLYFRDFRRRSAVSQCAVFGMPTLVDGAIPFLRSPRKTGDKRAREDRAAMAPACGQIQKWIDRITYASE